MFPSTKLETGLSRASGSFATRPGSVSANQSKETPKKGTREFLDNGALATHHARVNSGMDRAQMVFAITKLSE